MCMFEALSHISLLCEPTQAGHKNNQFAKSKLFFLPHYQRISKTALRLLGIGDISRDADTAEFSPG